MVSRTGMNIRDYLAQSAGVRAREARKIHERTTGEPAPGDFARLLSGLRSETPAGPSGMRIGEYFRSPVLRRHGGPAEAPRSSGRNAGGLPPLIPPLPTRRPRDDTRVEAPRALPVRTASADRDPTVMRDIDAAIEKAASRYDLSQGLIRSVIQAESSFQVRAVSPAGAQGLMQLMPDTARELGVRDPFDIDENIDGGARYLRQMLDLFDGDLRQALAAYNAGPGTVMKYGGDVPFRETRAYVAKIMAGKNFSPNDL